MGITPHLLDQLVSGSMHRSWDGDRRLVYQRPSPFLVLWCDEIADGCLAAGVNTSRPFAIASGHTGLSSSVYPDGRLCRDAAPGFDAADPVPRIFRTRLLADAL